MCEIIVCINTLQHDCKANFKHSKFKLYTVLQVLTILKDIIYAFLKSVRCCALDESSLSIGRV